MWLIPTADRLPYTGTLQEADAALNELRRQSGNNGNSTYMCDTNPDLSVDVTAALNHLPCTGTLQEADAALNELRRQSGNNGNSTYMCDADSDLSVDVTAALNHLPCTGTLQVTIVTVLTCVTPTRTSRLMLLLPLIISPALELFRKPIPPLMNPDASRFRTSSSFGCFDFAARWHQYSIACFLIIHKCYFQTFCLYKNIQLKFIYLW